MGSAHASAARFDIPVNNDALSAETSSTRSPMATPTRGASSPSQSRNTPKGILWMVKSVFAACADETQERRMVM